MKPAYRPISHGARDVLVDRRANGDIMVRAMQPLGPYPRKLTDRLRAVAGTTPDHLFLAVRDRDGPQRWRRLSYGQAWDSVQRIGQALVDRGLSQRRPVAILSGSSIEHALLSLAAMHVGIPHCAVTPAYSLLSPDHTKLRHVLALLEPGLVFADDGALFETAIDRALPVHAERVHALRAPSRCASTPFAQLMAASPTRKSTVASDAVEADSVAKILFTSGSTGMPKGVMTTQRMLSCNQQMFVQSFPCILDQPPVILSWLPWHHASGGNQMLGLTVYCGGTLYVDDGKPVADEIDKTVDNLREIAPTVYFNVPQGFAALAPHLRADAALREHFFSRLSLLYYSGSALTESLVREFDALAEQTVGVRIPMMCGYGATETTTLALAANWITERSGLAGLPVPGCELKLSPIGAGRYEARLKGPLMTPGYWGQPELNAGLRDENGYVRMGDALAWAVPDDAAQGLMFDGRLKEDFKLSTGTWVGVGALRAKLVHRGDGLFVDVVIIGEGHDRVAACIVANRAACAQFCALPVQTPWADVVAHQALRARIQEILSGLAASATGSSTYVQRAVVFAGTLDAAAGELTDKGSINQRAFIAHRSALVAALYTDPAPDQVYVVCT